MRPNILIDDDFFDQNKNPGICTGNKFTAMVEVKMMNVIRKYTIEFSKNQNSLVGTKRLKFSDFNIVPPKKMGGMVYVKNEIDLLFSLAIHD